jgi:anti-sigma B factor antagonist
MLPPDFSVTVRRTHDTVTLAVAGELDLAAAPLLAAHLDAVGAADGSGGVVLDLSGLTFLDSSGVALLIGVTQRAEREGWPLRIAGTPPEAHRVLEICWLLDVLPLVGERGAPR